LFEIGRGLISVSAWVPATPNCNHRDVHSEAVLTVNVADHH
jgi:hypothetical protein